MSVADCRAARRKMKERYGAGKRRQRSVAEAIAAEKRRVVINYKKKN